MNEPKGSNNKITAEVKVLQAPPGSDFTFNYAASISYEVYGIKLPFIDHEPLSATTDQEADLEAQERALTRCQTLTQILNHILNAAIKDLSVPDTNLESLPKHGENTPLS